MRRHREINESAKRAVDRLIEGMAGMATLDEVEAGFIQEAGKVVAGDCLCWNNWSVDWSHVIDFTMNDDYTARFAELQEPFAETVRFHPVIFHDHFTDSGREVKKMSDFQSISRFRENPLYREVYRYLDSSYQLSYTACVLRDRRILLTWNRRTSDFDDRESQLFQYLGERLGALGRRFEERELLEVRWRELCRFVDSRIPAGPASSLGEKDTVLMTALLKNHSRQAIASELGIRRDSVDKRLGSIREKLGLENHHQLLGALRELKAEKGMDSRSG